VDRIYIHKILWCSFIVALLNIFTPFSILAVTAPTSTYLSTITDGLHSPTRIAIGTDGKIYVTDSSKDRIQVYSPAGRLKYTVNNFMGVPLSIAVDSAGNFYVGDDRTKSVMVFDSNWQFLRKLGSGNREFALPGDIAVSASTGRIYVTDSKNNIVKIYNADGSLYSVVGSRGSNAGQFIFPTGIAVDDTNSELLVGDEMYNGTEWVSRIQIFDLNGNYTGVITLGASYNVKVQGITIDSLGRVYAVNPLKGRVDVYERTGTYLSSIGKIGTASGELKIPSDAVIDSNSRLLIASSDSSRVVLYGIDNYTIPIDPPDIYTLTVVKNGTGAGTVTSSPSGINCGSGCSAMYEAGTSVTLAATPAADSLFAGWSGACSGTGSCAISISGDTNVSASFTLENIPPVVAMNQPQPSVLAPPNGKMIAVVISGTVSDAQSGLKTVSYAVADEYNQYNSSGSITQNSDGTFSFTVSLKAAVVKKDPDGKRTYTISVTAIDNANNTSQGSVTVIVPRK